MSILYRPPFTREQTKASPTDLPLMPPFAAGSGSTLLIGSNNQRIFLIALHSLIEETLPIFWFQAALHPALHWKPPVSDWDPIKPSNSVSIKKSSETVPPIESQHICISAIVLTSKHLKISKNVESWIKLKKTDLSHDTPEVGRLVKSSLFAHQRWFFKSLLLSTPRSRNHEVLKVWTIQCMYTVLYSVLYSV